MDTLVIVIGIAGFLVTFAGVLMVVLREIFQLIAQDYRLKPEIIVQTSSKLKAPYLIEKQEFSTKWIKQDYTNSSAC